MATNAYYARRWGRRILAARHAAGLSQTDLARTLGVTRQAVQSWEVGRTAPSTPLRPAVAKALGVKVGALFSYDGAAA